MSQSTGGKIDCYVDCVSTYSFLAFTYLQKQRDVLQQYGIEVEFHPISLPTLTALTRNLPPWSLPRKARYMILFDNPRNSTLHSIPALAPPPFFPQKMPAVSLVAQRCLIYIKPRFSRAVYENAFRAFWVWIHHRHVDLSDTEELRRCLSSEEGVGLDGEQVEWILGAATGPEINGSAAPREEGWWKAEKSVLGSDEIGVALERNTREAHKRGAYGAPWFWMRNYRGEEEPIFGSDRWAHMWRFMGVEWREIEILPPVEEGKGKGEGSGGAAKL